MSDKCLYEPEMKLTNDLVAIVPKSMSLNFIKWERFFNFKINLLVMKAILK